MNVLIPNDLCGKLIPSLIIGVPIILSLVETELYMINL